MHRIKQHKNKILLGFLVVFALLLAFWWGGSYPENTPAEPVAIQTPAPTQDVVPTAEPVMPTKTPNPTPVPAETESPAPMATPEARPAPIEPENAVISDKALTCTLSVRCDTLLQNLALLGPEKATLVPADGVLYPEQTVTFYEGESVFNLLAREMKRNKIHLEFVSTPLYNSAYIEGIGNLYEFDCGELSGWMYRVNGWFPNYGCSRYQLQPGDRVEWVYSCDLGADVGGDYAARNGKDET